MRVIGIDPGAGGAIALLEWVNGEWKLLRVDDMPVRKRLKGPLQSYDYDLPKCDEGDGNCVDGKKVYSILRGMVAELCGGKVDFIIIEKVSAMRKEGRTQGTVSSFNFGDAFGIVRGIAELFGSVVYIEPLAWKSAAQLTKKPKDEARSKAKQMIDGSEAVLARKMDVDRADAMLIGVFGAMVLHKRLASKNLGEE